MAIPRQAVSRQRGQQRTRVYSVPAPIGGWNARDSRDAMADQDAVLLDNWFPDTGEIRMRRGYTLYTSGLEGNVETLAQLHAGTTRKFLACANGKFWDITDSNSPSSLGSGFSNNRWQWAAFNGVLGFVNGEDTPQQYDGSSLTELGFYLIDDQGESTDSWTLNTGWSHDTANDEFDHATGNTATLERAVANIDTALTYDLWIELANTSAGSVTVSFTNGSGGGSVSSNGVTKLSFTPSNASDDIIITPTSDFDGSVSSVQIRRDDLTPSEFIGVNVFKSRTYFWADNSQDFWYSDVNTFGGPMSKFPLSRISKMGGNLTAMGTWSRDGGDGLDDLAAFIMSSGEVIVYQGSNPGSASSWSLVGVYQIGRPLSVRGVVKFGGDLIVMTEDGYFPLSQAIQGRISNQSAISDKIRGAVTEASEDFRDNYGWEAILYPAGKKIIFNVPVATNAFYRQHVMNSVTGAWCRFIDINARTWGEYDGDLYFGENGKVFKAETGTSDNGKEIKADAWPAYNYLGSRGQRKRVVMGQAVMSSGGDLTINYRVNSDFQEPIPPFNTTTFDAQGSEWDDAAWNDAFWINGNNIINTWTLVSGVGFNFSLRVRLKVSGQNVAWLATNYAFEPIGVI